MLKTEELKQVAEICGITMRSVNNKRMGTTHWYLYEIVRLEKAGIDKDVIKELVKHDVALYGESSNV